MATKETIRNQIKASCQLLPYDIKRTVIRRLDQGYVRWLEEYVCSKPSWKGFMERQCLFIHITKCAGNSVHKGLLKTDGGLGHFKMRDYALLLSKKEFDQLFKFTFVRNPWDRLVSAYFFMKAGGWFERDQKWFDKHLSQFADFEDFVAKWVNARSVYHHILFTPQIDFVSLGARNHLPLDFIGRFETVEDDLRELADRFGVTLELRKDNPTASRPSYRDAYNAKTKDIVYRAYKQDIKLLDYEF